MPAAPEARLRPWERLRSRGEFQRVFRTGMRIDGQWFLLVAAPNGRPYRRLGLAASRRLGGAATRNRARRLLREAFRLNKESGPPSLDLVFVVKPGLAERSLAEVDLEYRRRLERLAGRQARSARSRPAHAD